MTPRASSTSGIMVSPNKVRPAKENPRGIRQRFTSDRERPTGPERTKGPPFFICVSSPGDALEQANVSIRPPPRGGTQPRRLIAGSCRCEITLPEREAALGHPRRARRLLVGDRLWQANTAPFRGIYIRRTSAHPYAEGPQAVIEICSTMFGVTCFCRRS